MIFYGIPSENRAIEIVEGITEGHWIIEDTVQKNIQELDAEALKERIREIILSIKEYKEGSVFVNRSTPFVFIHTPDDPKALKIYDNSSLACSSKLSPPRWWVYRKELSEVIKG